MGRDGAGRSRQTEIQTGTHPEREAGTLALCISVIFITLFFFLNYRIQNLFFNLLLSCLISSFICFTLCINLLFFTILNKNN